MVTYYRRFDVDETGVEMIGKYTVEEMADELCNTIGGCDFLRDANAALSKIRAEAEAELARVERHGGTAGFALRVKELCG